MIIDDHGSSDEVQARSRTITETDLVAFSALTGDWHPQHSDARWAADGPFGERVAHGMLVLAYAIGMIDFGDPDRIVALRGIRRATFKQPVHIGDTITVRGQLADSTELDAGTKLLRIAVQIVRADDDALVARAELEAVARSEGATPEPVR